MTAIGFGGIRVQCVLEVKVYESVESPAAGGIRILSKIPLRGARRASHIKGLVISAGSFFRYCTPKYLSFYRLVELGPQPRSFSSARWAYLNLIILMIRSSRFAVPNWLLNLFKSSAASVLSLISSWVRFMLHFLHATGFEASQNLR